MLIRVPPVFGCASREMSLPDHVEGDMARGGSSHSIDFRFLPRILTEKTRQLIETYHGNYGYSKLADLLWQSEIRVFIVTQRDLAPVFRKASTARSAKQANRGLVLIATTLLSLELLGSDFAGWGRRFPFAKRKADAILGEHLLTARTHLMEFYLYHWRRHMDRTLVDIISPPTSVIPNP